MCFLGFVVSFNVFQVSFPSCAPVPCDPDLLLVFYPQFCTFVFFLELFFACLWTWLIALFRTCLPLCVCIWVLHWTVTITPVCGNACYLSTTIVIFTYCVFRMQTCKWSEMRSFLFWSHPYCNSADHDWMLAAHWGLRFAEVKGCFFFKAPAYILPPAHRKPAHVSDDKMPSTSLWRAPQPAEASQVTVSEDLMGH